MSRRTNLLREPLNAVLATEAHVRVLRVLLGHGGELAPPEVARRARLTPQGVRQILSALVKVGMVEEVGLGRYRHYRVRSGNPLARALEALYAAEAQRYDDVLEAIRKAADVVPRRPSAVWLYGSAARSEDHVGSDVDVAVVFPEEPVEAATDDFREALDPLAERFGLGIALIGLSDDDVARLAAGDGWWEGLRKDARALVGPEPDRYARRVRRATRGGRA